MNHPNRLSIVFQEVNYDAVGISVIDMRYTPKEARRDGDKKAALLSIEDPLLISECF